MLPRHIYLHVPFCARRCSYCDFSIAVRRDVPVDAYVTALERELDVRFPRGDTDGSGWSVATLYLGGGTPSRLGGEGVARVLERLTSRLTLEAGAEVTLEANPDDITVDAVRAWRSAGVNRLSIGVQSFDDAVLRWMHRAHDAARVRTAVGAARAGGIDNFSVDLIFALPESLERDWDADLERALALAPAHVSLYGLTIEPATPLGRWRDRGAVAEAPEERYEDEFLRAHHAMRAAGFEHYEVSNFALPGAGARHNSSYWSGAPYLGLGPAAHGFDGRQRRWNVAAYTDWVRLLAQGRDPISGSEDLSDENRAAERVYLGLRTDAGLALTDAEAERVAPWVAAGWGTVAGGRLRLTPAGWLRLDALAADLTLVRSR